MPFLADVANHLLAHHQTHLGDCTVVFPNQRSGFFLKKQLSMGIEKPVWSPITLSLEDFLCSFSEIQKADSLTLIFELFEIFKLHQEVKEGFESFYFGGGNAFTKQIKKYLTQFMLSHLTKKKELKKIIKKMMRVECIVCKVYMVKSIRFIEMKEAF